MKRLVITLALVTALVAPAAAQGFHHGFVPGGPCGESTNSGGGNPTAISAIRNRNPAQGGANFPLPPTGTPGADHGQPTNPPERATCPAPNK